MQSDIFKIKDNPQPVIAASDANGKLCTYLLEISRAQ